VTGAVLLPREGGAAGDLSPERKGTRVTVVIVGAGLAGLRACESLRREGYADPLVLIGDETHAPYSRPPLSKEVLRGGEPGVAWLRADHELAALDVELRLGNPACRVDVGARLVHLRDGEPVAFDELVLATGAHARSLPGRVNDHVFTLRTMDDSLSVRRGLLPGSSVVVIGAGFIGLEAAASARQMGCDVTVVDVLPVPLDRVFNRSIGAAIQAQHEANGVRFRLGVGVERVELSAGGCRVILTDGPPLPASVVIVGIGVVPATEWLADSELMVQDGIVCSPSLRAAPHVWAVGDVARWAPHGQQATLRIEHWMVAAEMAEHVARNITHGQDSPFETVPYFWTDQFDAKIQSLGFTTKGDDVRVVTGSLEEQRWTMLVRAGDRLGGVVGMGSARHVMRGRGLLASAASWQEALAAYR
jgi:3-phenylpropionate/trans-cinnamate dioxygenase ferredoxin reductase component